MMCATLSLRICAHLTLEAEVVTHMYQIGVPPGLGFSGEIRRWELRGGMHGRGRW